MVKLADIQILRGSGLFDEDWYRARYQDVEILGMCAIEHYLWVGARLKRDPSPKFSTTRYLECNPDVEIAGSNPLVHYIRWGRFEGRQAFPVEPKASDTSVIPLARKRSERPSRDAIVYESHNLKLQGAPNSLFEIASGIMRRGNFEPVLMAPRGGPLQQSYAASDIECVFHGIPSEFLLNADRRNSFLQTLSKHYKDANAKLVHVNTLPNYHCVLAAAMAGIPVIWNVRESEDPDSYYDKLPPDLRRLAYSAFAKASTVVFVAEATRQKWVDKLSGVVESVTIHNGIDLGRLMRHVYATNRPTVRSSLGLREDDIVLLNVGTVNKRKGQQDIVDAVQILDDHIKRRLVIAMVGFSPTQYSDYIKQRLEALSKEGVRIIALDETTSEEERRRVAELYLASDIFVLTSRIESYPRVILEAMGFGLAIISTPCFGVKEQLVNGISGLFYEEEQIADLSGKIRLLCDDREKRIQLGFAARAQLSRLNSYDQMLDAYERVYKSVLRKNSIQVKSA
ncbi:glycosyltransferase family 4 protein [Mesorhizobium sp. RMAD-H1]|uniref:glycosyltransferase family 4 protein n=1 Tax=Mesorhizobium sp. RMAD-H1 TaxID=2587065 RepID=UPI0016226702|nr:glycosyltransferase family 4 protein [Mesorhizobium sp. RMAD-H1]MBB2973937.1 glycosyltransferase involved in cell wall biosynthesis [Mesorhizobium sp. RMAD-H1]